jgi:hypothetical protein
MEPDIRFTPTKRRLILIALIFGIIPLLPLLLIPGRAASQESLLTAIITGAVFAGLVIISNYARVTIVASDKDIEGPSRWLYFPTSIAYEKVDLARSRQRKLLSQLLGQYELRSVDGAIVHIDMFFLVRRQLYEIIALIEAKQRALPQ